MNAQITDRIPLYQDREASAGDYASITAFFGFIDDTLYFNEGPYRAGYFLNQDMKWSESWKLNPIDSKLDDDAYFGTGSQHFLDGPAVINVRESRNYRFIAGRKEKHMKYFVYFKDSQIVKANELLAETENTTDMYGMFNDLDGGLPFWPGRNGGDETYVQINDVARYIDLQKGLLKYYGTDKITPISQEVKSFCEQLDPNDNPVIMVVKLK